MRIVFGVLSLLIVVAVIAVLARKQLGAAAPQPGANAGSAQGVLAPSGTPKQQVQQFQQAVEGTLQQARPMPDDK
jgi:hypothetical protein